MKALAVHKKELIGKVLLHVAGNGQTERLISTIKELDLGQLVIFEGWADKAKKRHLLNLSDVYLLPSYIEGVPISILEAESYRKPVITTNVGGIPSIVKNRGTGLFVTPGDSDEIYRAIKTMIDDEELRHSFGEAGYMISKEYLPNTIKKELIGLYYSLINFSK